MKKKMKNTPNKIECWENIDNLLNQIKETEKNNKPKEEEEPVKILPYYKDKIGRYHHKSCSYCLSHKVTYVNDVPEGAVLCERCYTEMMLSKLVKDERDIERVKKWLIKYNVRSYILKDLIKAKMRLSLIGNRLYITCKNNDWYIEANELTMKGRLFHGNYTYKKGQRTSTSSYHAQFDNDAEIYVLLVGVMKHHNYKYTPYKEMFETN